eukprot:134723_1
MITLTDSSITSCKRLTMGACSCKRRTDHIIEQDQCIMLKETYHQRQQITHLNHESRILILGAGDFSFAASLSQLGYCNLVVTTNNDRDCVVKNYENAHNNIQIIKRMGNVVMYDIAINEIMKNDYFKALTEKNKFDNIIFNFPHTGVPNYDYRKSISDNQALLRSIFQQSICLLKRDGELQITLQNKPIYNSWDIQKQCNKINNRYRLKKRIDFKPELFFGYIHTSTKTFKPVSSKMSFIWIFGKYTDEQVEDIKWNPIKVEKGIKWYPNMYCCKKCNKKFNSDVQYSKHILSHQSNLTMNNKNK